MSRTETILPYRSWSGTENAICQDFLDKCRNDPDLLIFPRDNYLSVYCGGRGFATMTPSQVTPAAPYEKNDVGFQALKEKISASMPKDKERRAQHQIVANHRNRATDIVICDFEFKIREEDFNGTKGPEIDLAGIDFSNPALPRPVFIEYKRSPSACKNLRTGIEAHYQDFAKICKNPALKKALAEGVMASYNILVDIGVLKTQHITKINTEEPWFAFLFTDLPVKNFYGYLSKIQAQHMEQAQDGDFGFPLLVASFATKEEAVLQTDAFREISQFLSDNQAQSSKHNRYRPHP